MYTDELDIPIKKFGPQLTMGLTWESIWILSFGFNLVSGE